MRDGLPVVAPLTNREWSISTPTEYPDRRLHDQLIVSMGYKGNPNSEPTNISLRIGNNCVVLDRPARRALRRLFTFAEGKDS